MGQISVETKYGPIDFKISGDSPTIGERLEIDRIIANPRAFLPKSALDDFNARQKGFDPEFNTERGVRNTPLRASLSLAETPEEEELALARAGLLQDDYTRDYRGRLALTPSGAEKFGIQSDKNILIDESGFSKYDIADLAGLAPEVVSAIAGTIAGQAAIPVPILGGVIGAALGGASGSLLEEGIEAGMGTSKQDAEEIAKDALIEGAIAGAGEGVFASIFKAFGIGARGLGPSKLTPEQAVAIKESMDEGIMPAPGLVGAPALIGRAVATEEQIFKGSARTRANNDAINAKLDQWRQYSQNADPEEVGSILMRAVKEGDKQLLRAEQDAGKAILRGMQSMADDLGRASELDVQLAPDLLKSFKDAYDLWSNQAAQKFAKINQTLDSAIGNNKFIPTGDIAKKAGKVRERYLATQPGTTGGELDNMLSNIQRLGDKSSFGTLYEARKSLNDLLLNPRSTRSVNIQKYGEEMRNIIDGRLDMLRSAPAVRSLLDNARATQTASRINNSEIEALKNAASDLPEARRFYEEGMRLFNDVGGKASVASLRRAAIRGEDVDPTSMVGQFVKNNNPKPLLAAQKVLERYAPGTYAPLKERIASEWIRQNLAKSIDDLDPSKFKPIEFKKAVDKLGSTADELFGANADQVRNLANQISSLSLKNVDQSVLDRAMQAGVTDNGIDLLRNLNMIQKEAHEFQTQQTLRALRDGNIDPISAANLIVQPGTKPTVISKLVKYFDNEPEAMAKIQGHYMDNIIGDFGESFLVEPKQFKIFGERLKKEYDSGKLTQIFGEEMAKDMAKFGRVLSFNARTVEGGGLIAANIAASPIQNMGKLIRYSLIGRVFSSPLFYKNLSKKIDAMTAESGSRTAALGNYIAQSLSAAIAQTGAQSLESGVEEATDQATAAMNSMMEERRPARQKREISEIPTISQPQQVAMPQTEQMSNLRQRAANDPALASTLLGGLGNASLLNR